MAVPSAYEGAIYLQFPGLAPNDHFSMAELSGTAITNSGISALNLATNGTVVRGYQSGLPGDPAGFATGQNKDTVMATRGDNGTFDRPATTNKLSILGWFRPDDMRLSAGASEYTLLMKGGDTFGITVTGGSLRVDINGVTPSKQLISEIGDLIRPRTWMHIATTFDGAAQTWKLFVNGVVVASRGLPTGQVVNHAAGGTLQVGGYNAFGAAGIHGRMQHWSVFNAHALSDTVIQALYRVGIVRPGSEGDEAMYLFPWNREIVSTGGAYKTIQFTNMSPYPVSLSQGGTAAMGAGITLAPRGGRLPKPSTYNGAWSAILNARFGYSVLGIEKTY